MEFDGGTGTTKDVTEFGVRFHLDQPLTHDQSISLWLLFRDFAGGDQWRMAARGKVIRVEESGTGFVVAVRVTSFTLAEAPSAP